MHDEKRDYEPPNESRDDTERLLLQVRKTAAYVFVGLIVLLLLMDRVGPVISDDYVGLGDTALGLMLGALLVLIVGQGIDFFRRFGP